MKFHAVRQVLDVAATLALLVAAAATIWVMVNGANPTGSLNGATSDNLEQAAPVELSASAATLEVGRESKLVMVEFSDYQCPYCGQFATEVFPKLRASYVDTGKLKYIFKNAPVEVAHPFAKKTA